MDDIIEKLENISKFLNLLENRDQIEFLSNTNDIITDLDKNVNELHDKIINFELSSEKHNQIEIKNKKNKVIAKSLFPCYWMLTECLNSETDYNEIEQYLYND